MPHRIITTIDGRRGGALALIALMFLTVGAGNLRAREDRSVILRWMPEWFTNVHLGAILLLLSAVALAGALMSKRSTRALAIGFQAALTAALLMAGLYAIAATQGSASSITLAVIFGVFAFLIYSISAWDDARTRPPLTGEQRRVLEEGE